MLARSRRRSARRDDLAEHLARQASSCSSSTTSSICSTRRPPSRALLAASERLQRARDEPRAAARRGEQRVSGSSRSPTDAVELFVERARAVGRELRARRDRRRDLPAPRRPPARDRARRGPREARSRRAAARAARRSGSPLLTGGARDAPERQRTLRATIEWSYDLLDDERAGALRAHGRLRGRLPARGRGGGLPTPTSTTLAVARRLQPRQADRRRPLPDARDDPRVRGRAARTRRTRTRSARGTPSTSRSLAEEAYERRFEAEAEWSGAARDSTTTTCAPLSTGSMRTTRPRAPARRRPGVVLAHPRTARRRVCGGWRRPLPVSEARAARGRGRSRP